MRRCSLGSWLFAVGVVAAAAALAWLSWSMLKLEGRESVAQAELEREVAISDVLWRMDAWLSPIIAHEAQRPADDYRAFSPVLISYDSMLGQLEPGQVIVPSPLLTYRSELFPLHFVVDALGQVSSPQVPAGNELDAAQAADPEREVSQQSQLLARLDGKLRLQAVLASCQVIGAAPAKRGWTNFEQRARNSEIALNNVMPSRNPIKEEVVSVAGPLMPMWFQDEVGNLLLFVRRVRDGAVESVQGFVADWPAVREALLTEVSDVPAAAHGACLEPRLASDDAPLSRCLSAVPAVFSTDALAVSEQSAGWTPVCSLLALTWLAFVGVAMIGGFALRQALNFGDRRARFAAAVAHELRTPLTTFRMYSELLAEDMVKDPQKRREYLGTLQSESDRLARLVENVLSYARVEDGRFTSQREMVGLQDLLGRHRAVLDRRCVEVERELVVTLEGSDARLSVDVEAVGQILFNLVDNACKYGSGPIELCAGLEGRWVELAVRDYGAGISPAEQARIFGAFDRGQQAADKPSTAGVGLGLALARGLARDLGGDLSVEDAQPGVRFVLRLPAQ